MIRLRNSFYFLFLALLSLFCLFLASCHGFFDFSDEEDKESEKAYISLSLASSRTVLPQLDVQSALFTLRGTKDGGEEITLLKDCAYSSFQQKPIAIEAGEYSFTLSTVIDGVTFSDTIEAVQVQIGNTVELSFYLTAQQAESGSHYVQPFGRRG